MMLQERHTLTTLPPAADFGDHPPWSPITSKTLADVLHLDRGLLATWRVRGIGPPALPETWFRGRANHFRPSAVQAWLAARHGGEVRERDLWAAHLSDWLGMPIEAEGAPALAHRFAESAGPRFAEADGVQFTVQGWRTYLASLGAML